MKVSALVAACHSASCRPPTSGGTGGSAKGKTVQASSSPHYKRRGDQRPLSESDALALVREKDATGRRILDKGVTVPLGKAIGVRANLNVKKTTGITVQTMHDGTDQQLAKRTGFFGGEAIGYGAAVTLSNVNFSVNQQARHKIATGQSNKFPMASVDGRKAAPGADEFDGVEVRFNPMKTHLFVDPSGRAVKSAEFATVSGSSVYVRGKITYYDETDAPKAVGDVPSDATFSANLRNLMELACHSKACAPPPAGTGGSLGAPSGPRGVGPDPKMLGIPHLTPVEGKPGTHHVFTEKGGYKGMSSTEQANRYVTRRKAQLKGVATRARAKATADKASFELHDLVELACRSATCRPPTSGGTGGSSPKGGSGPTAAQRKAYNSGYAAAQRGSWDALGRADQRRVPREWYAGYHDADAGKPKGSAFTDPEYAPLFQKAASPPHKVITPEMARGDSRPVSAAEFQRLGDIGRKQLAEFAAKPTGTAGLDANWDKVKEDGYAEVTQSWGGATFSARTGEALPQGVNKYAITVKTPGKEPVSIPETATRAEFDAAMDEARSRFGEELGRQQHHLGVFHDDANNRIDIDPVLVVDNSRDVETIGVASHAIGGAYNFQDGNGYWPPHVDESPSATASRDDYSRTYEGDHRGTSGDTVGS